MAEADQPPPTFRATDLRSQCVRNDTEFDKQPLAYEFNHGKRKFESSDRNGSGLYQDPS